MFNKAFSTPYFLSVAVYCAAIVQMLTTTDVFAVPAFARQVGVDCNSCHFQHFSKLREFGRYFKANGYSQSSQTLLEADDLSVPSWLNLSFYVKTRVVKDNTGKAELNFPDEAALLYGGRLADGIGGIVEMSDAILSYKIAFTTTTNSGSSLGLTAFTTDGLGAGYGFELMNTGAVANLRPFERAAKPSLGANGLDLSGPATGVVFHAADANWFVALTFFAPDDTNTGATNMDFGSDLSAYVRAAWIQSIGEQEIGIGFGKFSGEAKATDSASPATLTFKTNAMYIDLQLQGALSGRELGAYLMYAKGDDDPTGLYSAGYDDEPTAVGLDVEYSILPELHLLLSAGSYDNGGPGSNMNRYGVGLFWKIQQNINLQPMYEKFSGDQRTLDRRATLQLEAAF